MKIYVDENDYVITYCAMTGRESLETSKTPIIVESLSEYTKQVREEVVEEIKKFANSIFTRYEKRELDDVAYGELVCCNILIKKISKKRSEINNED